MLILHVHIHVKPEFLEAFRAATIENARQSIQEPGIARFDLLEQATIPIASRSSKSIEARTRRRSINRPRTTPNGWKA